MCFRICVSIYMGQHYRFFCCTMNTCVCHYWSLHWQGCQDWQGCCCSSHCSRSRSPSSGWAVGPALTLFRGVLASFERWWLWLTPPEGRCLQIAELPADCTQTVCVSPCWKYCRCSGPHAEASMVAGSVLQTSWIWTRCWCCLPPSLWPWGWSQVGTRNQRTMQKVAGYG